MKTDELRKLAAQCQKQAQIETTLKTAQVVEAMAGLGILKRKLSR